MSNDNFKDFLMSFESNNKEENKKESVFNKKDELSINEEKLVNNKDNDSSKEYLGYNPKSKPINIKINKKKKENDNLTRYKNEEIVETDVYKEPLNDLNVLTEENKEINLNQLFIESETAEIWRDQWFSLVKKAEESTQKTITNKKIKNGKFKIDDDGKIEILPDHKIHGKTSNLLLNEQWEIN